MPKAASPDTPSSIPSPALPAVTPGTAPNRRAFLGRLALAPAAATAGLAALPARAAPAVGPDGELILVCAAFDLLTGRFMAAYEGPDAIQDDDECEAAGIAITARQDALLNRLCALRATTLEGHLARARTLMLHDQQIKPDALVASRYTNERLLGLLLRDLAEGASA